jgi:DhnA family fructose-bisphosphate aldolase class Ia
MSDRALRASAVPPNDVRGISTGKGIRMRRLLDPESGTCRIVALDHGMTSPVFLDGLANMPALIEEVVAGGANVLMLGRGAATAYWQHFAGEAALALMLTASAAGRPAGSRVTPIGSVDEALRLGADGVVVYVALGGDDEPAMISYLSKVAEACDRSGMPLIAEAEFPDAYAASNSAPLDLGADYLLRNVRLCADLGADIIKVNWCEDKDQFSRIVLAADRPVVLAGGPVISDELLLSRMQDARDVGAVGFSVGRNVFEHPEPRAMTRALARVFADRWSDAEALAELAATSSDGRRQLEDALMKQTPALSDKGVPE